MEDLAAGDKFPWLPQREDLEPEKQIHFKINRAINNKTFVRTGSNIAFCQKFYIVYC